VSTRVLFRLGVAATVADVITTFVALRFYGSGLREANPIAAQAIGPLGLEGMLLLRLLVGLAVCVAAARLLTSWRAGAALVFAAGFWALVAASNVYEIANVA